MIGLLRMRNALWAMIAMAFLLLPAIPASAATVTYNILFTATGIPGPTTTAGGLFQLTFDPTHLYAGPGDYADSSFSTTFLSIPVDSPVSFVYLPSLDELFIGGDAAGTGILESLENDFALIIGSFSTSPSLIAFALTNGTPFTSWNTNSGTVIVQAAPVVAATPIPGALPLLVTALGGLVGWKVSRRRRIDAAAA